MKTDEVCDHCLETFGAATFGVIYGFVFCCKGRNISYAFVIYNKYYTKNFLSADYAGWSDDEHLQELMLQMTTAATKEAAFAAWEEIQYYCYSDYCPILMMGHFHQAAACTNRLTGYNVFLTTNFWNAKLAK